MKNRFIIKLICILIVIASVFAGPTAFAEDRTDIPQGYVITDGTTYYWISYDELLTSYVSYSIDPNSEEGKLAKFYFDTLGDDVMSSLVSYVSGVTIKFVSFEEILGMYIVSGDVDGTYIWFNSVEATPAFDATTEVKIMGPEGTITGKVYVGADGYIIILPNDGIIIPGFKSINIDANQTNVYLNLNNPVDNPCYFVISLILDDGTVLYESVILLPGEVVGDITLTEPLAPGEYDASILYEALDLSDFSPLNNAQVNIKLIAE